MITIKRTKEDLLNQYKFIHELVFAKYYRGYIKLGLIITVIITLATAISWTVIDSTSLLALKGVLFLLTIFCWVFFLFLLAWYGHRKYKAVKSVKKGVTKAISDQRTFCVAFDEEKIVFVSDDFKVEYKWSIFSCYADTTKYVYLFQSNRSYYECTSFSDFEIGSDNLERLRQIVRVKLPHVDRLTGE